MNLIINSSLISLFPEFFAERIKPKEDKLAELRQAITPFETTKSFLDTKAQKVPCPSHFDIMCWTQSVLTNLSLIISFRLASSGQASLPCARSGV